MIIRIIQFQKNHMCNPYDNNKKYNAYNQKLDYTDYTLIIHIIFLCDYTDIFFEIDYLDYTDYM